MSYRKGSDRAIDYGLTRFWRSVRYTHYARITVHRAFLAFGFTAVIFLPLAEMSKPTDSSGNISFNKHYASPKEHPHEVLELKIENNTAMIENNTSALEQNRVYIANLRSGYDDYSRKIGEIQQTILNLDGGGDTVVRIMAQGLRVVSIPPITVQWHRAAFENVGDMFWAIPSRDLSLVLTVANPACSLIAGCDAQFTMKSTNYAVPSTDLVFANQMNDGIDERMVPQFETAEPSCSVRRQDRYQYLHCTFQPQPPNTLDPVCMHIRRSATDETAAELVALDVRWADMPDTACPLGEGSLNLALNPPIIGQ